tara:strand:- start:163 stop:489 length:327 start_codon:yes stop_codon:yes gene_type:complete
MRNCFIAVIALVFLSGCGEKDPAKEFIGKWNIVGSPQKGIVIQEGGKGFAFSEKESGNFTWRLKNDNVGIFLDVDGAYLYTLGEYNLNELRFDESYLKSRWYRFERAK